VGGRPVGSVCGPPSPPPRWHAYVISSYWLASVSLQDKRGILYSTQSHRSAWRSATTSRMSWLSGTTPLTEHINCSICCASSLHAEVRPTDPTILQHTPALRVSSARHWRPSLPSAAATPRWFRSYLLASNSTMLFKRVLSL